MKIIQNKNLVVVGFNCMNSNDKSLTKPTVCWYRIDYDYVKINKIIYDSYARSDSRKIECFNHSLVYE